MKKFNHLNIPDKWQQYWTRYPQGYTILEALINWTSQVNKMVDNQNDLNTNVEQFRNEIDDFIGRFDKRLQDEVSTTLSDWHESGFLDIVIDQALETKYHEMDERLTSQLAQTTKDLYSKSINVISPPLPYVGAVGDGETDDSEVIETLLNTFRKLYFPEGYSFLIGQTISSNDLTNVALLGKGTIIGVENIISFNLTNIDGLTISDLIFDGQKQRSEGHETNYFVEGKDIKNIRIENTNLLNGSNGISIENAENYLLINNHGENFDGWPFSVSGHSKNITWKNNTSINNTYDGLKMTGVIENVLVSENICYGNGRDGFDFAGQSVDGLKVMNNLFNENGIEGVEIKLLNPTDYPTPPGVERKYKNVVVDGNMLKENGSFGLNMTNRHINNIAETKSVLVKNNTISKHNGYQATTYGMRLQLEIEKHGDAIIEENTIIGDFGRGIRIINSERLVIKKNTVQTESRAIELEVQLDGVCSENIIEMNDASSTTSNAIAALTETNDNIIRHNRLSSPNSQYRVNVSPTSINNLSYGNEWKDYDSDQIPTNSRATKGDIAYSTDMVSSGCLGWVAMDTSANATWKPFGEIVL